MDFAALLIVIELDEFLMCYPGQVYARKHFEGKFLLHEFENPEVQTLIKIQCLSYFTSWLTMLLRTLEFATKLLTKAGVLVIVILINFEYITQFKPLEVKEGIYDF